MRACSQHKLLTGHASSSKLTCAWCPQKASDAAARQLSCSPVQVANRCCQGRIVSVLEGGYRIRGGLVSAFARSVAAHVAGLNSGSLQVQSANMCL